MVAIVARALEGTSATALLDRLIVEGADQLDYPGIVFAVRSLTAVPPWPVVRTCGRLGEADTRASRQVSAPAGREVDIVIHSFVVVIDGVDLTSPDSPDADLLYEAGCDDAALTSSSGAQRAVFDREAPSFAAAVASAITAIEGSIPGARVTAIERLDPAGASPLPRSA